VAAVAADGLTQLLRKVGGANGKGGGRGSALVARGSPSYRWRRRVVKAIKRAGGDAALRRLAGRKSSKGSGKGKDHASKQRGASAAVEDAAGKAAALLALVAFTKEVLARARREARCRRGPARGEDADDEEDEEEDPMDDDDGSGGGSDLEDSDDDEQSPEAIYALLGHRDMDSRGPAEVGSRDDDAGADDADDWGLSTGGGDDWGDEGGGGDGGGEGSRPMGGRVVTVTSASKKAPASSPGGLSPGKVLVRRLGPESRGGDAMDVGDEDTRMRAAMELLEKDLGLVRMDDEAYAKVKRGWASAWDV